jgi:hypothetical protein
MFIKFRQCFDSFRYGGVLKCGIPKIIGFNTKIVLFRMIWGYHFRKPPYRDGSKQSKPMIFPMDWVDEPSINTIYFHVKTRLPGF